MEGIEMTYSERDIRNSFFRRSAPVAENGAFTKVASSIPLFT
jgi:hypothetical protein